MSSYHSPKTEIRSSPIQGKGIFAIERIHQGEVVAVKGGHIFGREKLEEIEESLGPAEIQIGDGLFIGPVTQAEREGSMLFLNHSCNPNVGVRGQIVFVAMRNIDPGEEITQDWAMTDDDENTRMECHCGSDDCRRTITGKDWKIRRLQEKYAGYMSWYIEEKIRKRKVPEPQPATSGRDAARPGRTRDVEIRA